MHARLVEPEQLPRSERDRRLVQAAMRGRPEAIEHLVARLACIARILRARNRRLGVPLRDEDLEDLQQDVVAVAWRTLGDFRGDSSLETWLYAVCALELHRAARRRDSQATLEMPEELAAHECTAEESAQDLLVEALGLPAQQAECVRLRGLHRASFAEIAGRLTIPISTAKTHYYRGLQRLRVLVGPVWRQEQG